MIEIIDKISIITGRILFFVIAIALIIFLIQWCVRRLEMYDVYFKALCYHILSKQNRFAHVRNKIDLRKGRRWSTKYKKKDITWEIVKIIEN